MVYIIMTTNSSGCSKTEEKKKTLTLKTNNKNLSKEVKFISRELVTQETSVSPEHPPPTSAWQAALLESWTLRSNKKNKKPHKHTHAPHPPPQWVPSGLVSGHLQLPLGDEDAPGGRGSSSSTAAGHQGGQRGDGHRRVEEAVLGEAAACGRGQRLRDTQNSVS